MTTKQMTKEKFFQVGSKIVHRKGFNHTGILELLRAANVPKGSFYFYFKNKEDFGLQLIDFFAQDFFLSRIKAFEDYEKSSPIHNLRRFFLEFLPYYEKNDFEGG